MAAVDTNVLVRWLVRYDGLKLQFSSRRWQAATQRGVGPAIDLKPAASTSISMLSDRSQSVADRVNRSLRPYLPRLNTRLWLVGATQAVPRMCVPRSCAPRAPRPRPSRLGRRPKGPRRPDEFDAFLKSGFARALIKDVGTLSPEAMVKLEQAFAEAKAGWEVAAKRAVDLGMTDVELERAMKIWAGKPDLDSARFVSEILEPMADARKTVPEFAKVMKQTETLPGGVASLEEALVKAAGDPAYAKQLGPYFVDLRREIEALDPTLRKALPDASKEALDAISREAGEQLLKDADIKTATSLHQAPPKAELDPARMKAYEWNSDTKLPNPAEAIGGAPLERVLGGNLEKGTEEGVDFVIKSGTDTKVSLKRPLISKKTGGTFPIKNKNLTELAEAIVGDITTKSATKLMVVDMLGLSVEQKAFLQAEIKRILDQALAKGTPGLIIEPVMFTE